MSALFVPEDHFRVLTPAEIFPHAAEAPLEIDLGCGDGLFTEAMARHHPERNFLAVERLKGRVEKVIRRIQRHQLPNARILRLESAYTVRWLLPSTAVSRLHLLCPDPWPKKRHHKHRLVNQPDFLDGLQRILVPGSGEFLLKTDHPEYFEDARASLANRACFQPLDWPEDAFFYPRTDFERQWLESGRTIHRARWRLLA